MFFKYVRDKPRIFKYPRIAEWDNKIVKVRGGLRWIKTTFTVDNRTYHTELNLLIKELTKRGYKLNEKVEKPYVEVAYFSDNEKTYLRKHTHRLNQTYQALFGTWWEVEGFT